MQPDWTARTRRILVVGPSSSGKSSWLEVFLRGWTGRVFAFDHKGELYKRCGLRACSQPVEVAAALSQGRAAFNPHASYEGRTLEAFELWCRVTLGTSKVCSGEKLFIADELQDWISTAPGGLPQPLAAILESGRGYHLHSVCLAQATNLVNSRLRQQFNEVVAFRQTDPRANDFLRAVGVECAEPLERLQFVHRNLETGAQKIGRIAFTSGRAEISSR